MEPQPLTEEQVVREGGWDLSYAEVLKLEVRGDVAFARIDTNGNRQEIEDTFYLWDGNSWLELGSNGWGTSGSAGWASGEAPGSHDVTLDFGGRRFVVPVDENGEWWFVGRASSSSGEWPDIPQLVVSDERA